MADNYLEKKFEEYRAKKAASNRKTRLTPSGNKPGTLTVKFPCRRVFVTGGASGIGKSHRVGICQCRMPRRILRLRRTSRTANRRNDRIAVSSPRRGRCRRARAMHEPSVSRMGRHRHRDKQRGNQPAARHRRHERRRFRPHHCRQSALCLCHGKNVGRTSEKPSG